MQLKGILRYSYNYKFYCQDETGRKFSCSEYEQTIATKNELLCKVLFHVNENDDAIEIELVD